MTEVKTEEKKVGLLGATSLVGQCLLPLLKQSGWQIKAFSRRPPETACPSTEWIQLKQPVCQNDFIDDPTEKITHWICVASIWVFPDYFHILERYGAKRVIAVSSTSRFTKSDSADAEEKMTAQKLSESENRLETWAQTKGIDWIILRPTLIYGLGRDKNISELIRLIRRIGFFPLAGQAKGLRQPIHAEDLAAACLSALEKVGPTQHAYDLSGGETITYREMINRLFAALGRNPRIINIPLWFFKIAVILIHLFPRYRHWTAQMAERMNTDMIFDHADAIRDLNFSPRAFQITVKDLP